MHLCPITAIYILNYHNKAMASIDCVASILIAKITVNILSLDRVDGIRITGLHVKSKELDFIQLRYGSYKVRMMTTTFFSQFKGISCKEDFEFSTADIDLRAEQFEQMVLLMIQQESKSKHT